MHGKIFKINFNLLSLIYLLVGIVLLLWMQFLKFWRPFRTDNELLATVSWVVWNEPRLAPMWRRGDWSPKVWGGIVCSRKPSLLQVTFCPLFFPPLYYFHPDFTVSSTDLFLYCPEPLKIITETIAADLKAFRDTVWTREQAKPQRAEALFQARKNGYWEFLWMLVQTCALLSSFCMCGCPAYIVQLCVYQHFGGLKVIVIRYSKLQCQICKSVIL